MVNGHQMTVCWHVDALKVSHKEERAVTALAMKLGELYGSKTIICCGKAHEYLGMDMDWATIPATMIASMIKSLFQIIEEFPEVIKGTRSSPAGDHLFNVRGDVDWKLLPDTWA